MINNQSEGDAVNSKTVDYFDVSFCRMIRLNRPSVKTRSVRHSLVVDDPFPSAHPRLVHTRYKIRDTVTVSHCLYRQHGVTHDTMYCLSDEIMTCNICVHQCSKQYVTKLDISRIFWQQSQLNLNWDNDISNDTQAGAWQEIMPQSCSWNVRPGSPWTECSNIFLQLSFEAYTWIWIKFDTFCRSKQLIRWYQVRGAGRLAPIPGITPSWLSSTLRRADMGNISSLAQNNDNCKYYSRSSNVGINIQGDLFKGLTVYQYMIRSCSTQEFPNLRPFEWSLWRRD